MFDTNLLTENGVDLEKSLELFGDIATYNDNLDEFLDGVSKLVVDLTKYKNDGDMNNYSILVHSLKSDAKYYGFTKLAEIALDHELKSKEDNVWYVRDKFEELITEINRITEVVRKYLGIDFEKSEINNTTNGKEVAILVVDDSNIISNFVSKIFNDKYDVIVAKDGVDAINKLSVLSPNILGMLLDINMPNANGYDVLKFMQTNDLFKQINVAVISGTDSNELLETTKEYPVKAILEKPFNEENVKKVVEIILKR